MVEKSGGEKGHRLIGLILGNTEACSDSWATATKKRHESFPTADAEVISWRQGRKRYLCSNVVEVTTLVEKSDRTKNVVEKSWRREFR